MTFPGEHICEVCCRYVSEHPSACYDDSHGDDVPVYHMPLPCCEGCPCGSWEDMHWPDWAPLRVDSFMWGTRLRFVAVVYRRDQEQRCGHAHFKRNKAIDCMATYARKVNRERL